MSPCSFSVSVTGSARNMKPLCGGQLCATVTPSSIVCAGAAQHPTKADCHSQPQHSYLGNPGKHPRAPHRAHPTQTNQALGWCYTTSWLPWDSSLWSKLGPCCSSHSHRQWPFVHTSREKGACSTGLLQEDFPLPAIPRLMAKSLSPPKNISRRKGVE